VLDGFPGRNLLLRVSENRDDTIIRQDSPFLIWEYCTNVPIDLLAAQDTFGRQTRHDQESGMRT
jgi:hypothetical protein